MYNNYFENTAARILAHIDNDAGISESVYQDSPYYLNENYGSDRFLNEDVNTSLPQNMSYDESGLDDDGVLISKHVELAAAQIFAAFVESKNGKIKPEYIQYITDPDLLAAISRKTTQLQAILKSCYDKTIAKELIEQAIRRQLKYLAYNG